MLYLLFPSQIYMLKSNFLMTLGGRTFGRWLVQESGALMNGICARMEESPGRCLVPYSFYLWGHSEKTTLCGQDVGSGLPEPWFWSCQPSELWEIKKLPSLWYFWYSSLNRLRQWVKEIIQMHSSFFVFKVHVFLNSI